MKQHLIPVVLTSLVGFTLVGPANADLVVAFSADDGATFSDSFDVNVGDNLVISVFLQESLPDTVLSAEGLSAFGLDVTTSPGDLGVISAATPNPQFESQFHNVSTASGFEWEFGDTAGPTITGNTIPLGSFQFAAASEGTTVFTVEDRLIGVGIGSGSWLTPSLTILDEQIFGPGATGNFQFAIHAAAVPEPGSGGTLLGFVVWFTAIRRKRPTCRLVTA